MNEEHIKALLDGIGRIKTSIATLFCDLKQLEAMIPEPGWRLRAPDETFTDSDFIYDPFHCEWRKLVYPGRVGIAIVKTKQ